MRALTRLSLRRPKVVLASWWSVMGLLALVGLGVQERLHRASLDIPGSQADRAADLAAERFGESNSLIVLLKGPPAELERQGIRLAKRLESKPHVRVLGPWAPGARGTLQPQPNKTLLLVRADQPFEQVSREIAPSLREEVERSVRPPLEAHLSGYPDAAAGIHQGSVDALRHAELTAAPLLMLILLLVFRSPVAAAVPLAIGFTTIGAASGVLDLINRMSELDVVAMNLASMMGLALGVDYSLLLVSRFREELAGGTQTSVAAATAVATAGRTVLFAGIALGAALTTSYLVSPGNLLSSAAFGTMTAVGLSVIASLTALPATLVLLGPRIDKWRFGRREGSRERFGGLAVRTLRRPAVAALLVLGLLLILSAPALGLQSGPPDLRVLPENSVHRADYEAIQDELGSGWGSPFEITLAVRDGPVTDPKRLAAIDRWQREQSRQPGVAAVMGPGAIAQRADGLDRASKQLAGADRTFDKGLRDQRRLEDGLERAGAGVAELRGGMQEAAKGAQALEAGGSRAQGGAGELRAGLDRAGGGAEAMAAGLADAEAGAAALATGAGRARDGAARLRRGLDRARDGTAAGRPAVRRLARGLAAGADGLRELRRPVQTMDHELRQAMNALETMLPTSRLDPQYERAYRAVATAYGNLTGVDPRTGERPVADYPGLDAALAQASTEARRAASGVRELAVRLARLDRGLGRLERGASVAVDGLARLDSGLERLVHGLDALSSGGGALTTGLARLDRGAAALQQGTAELESGAEELGGGLASGAERTRVLSAGIGRMHEGVVASRVRTKRLGDSLGDAGQLGRALQSGYFVLAALDSAAPEERRASTFAVNLDRGGSAAQIVVIGEGEVWKSGHPLRERLEREIADLERATGGEARLGGPATVLQDFDTGTSGRFWILVLALMLVTYLVLVPVLRSLILPALAVVLNVMTVAAAFGVLVVLFSGDAPLGGPGWIDAIMLVGIFSIVFGLSIDYEVFLLARMREGWLRARDSDAAIRYGVERTAGVVTGAALIMTGVFVAFALTDLVSMRQFGIGLTVAVLLDATLVRLVLLPAAMRLCGDACWWLPAWLDRLLPELDVDGDREAVEGVGVLDDSATRQMRAPA